MGHCKPGWKRILSMAIRYLINRASLFPSQSKKVKSAGNNRQQAQDSRIYGPVKIKDTMGKLMWDLRRRNL